MFWSFLFPFPGDKNNSEGSSREASSVIFHSNTVSSPSVLLLIVLFLEYHFGCNLFKIKEVIYIVSARLVELDLFVGLFWSLWQYKVPSINIDLAFCYPCSSWLSGNWGHHFGCKQVYFTKARKTASARFVQPILSSSKYQHRSCLLPAPFQLVVR